MSDRGERARAWEAGRLDALLDHTAGNTGQHDARQKEAGHARDWRKWYAESYEVHMEALAEHAKEKAARAQEVPKDAI